MHDIKKPKLEVSGPQAINQSDGSFRLMPKLARVIEIKKATLILIVN